MPFTYKLSKRMAEIWGLGLVAWLALAPICGAQASRPAGRWTATNVVLAGAFATAVWIDLAQTRFFLKDPHWQEGNPLLGKHPSSLKVDMYGLVAAGATIGMAHLVRNPWRIAILALGSAIEMRVIAYNSGGGIGIRF